MISMTVMKDAKDFVNRNNSHVHWVKLVIAFVGFIAISFAFAELLIFIRERLNINLFEFELLAYISVFFVSLLANATIIAPVPFAIAIMVGAAKEFNPLIIALCGAAGGSLGELSGYYAGRLGKKIAIPDTIIGYKKIEGWINKYGFWAISVLAFQPILPFDVGGLIAGIAKMPLHKFLPALFIGKFPKYVLLVYAGMGLIGFLPNWLS
jgi:membrane protein YqaA with SNARE-associated domain